MPTTDIGKIALIGLLLAVIASSFFISAFGVYVVIITALSLYAVFVREKQIALPQSRLGWAMLLYLAWLGIATYMSVSKSISFPYLTILGSMPLGFFIWSRVYENQQSRKWLTILVPLSAAMLAVAGIIQDPSGSLSGKPVGTFKDPNLYAGTLSLLYLPLIAKYLYRKNALPIWPQLVNTSIIAISLLAFFMANSRGATLAFAAALVLLIWKTRKTPHPAKKLLALSAIIVAAYCAAFAITGSGVTKRLDQLAEHGDSSRVMLFEATTRIALDHPVTGTGLATFKVVYPKYRSIEETLTSGLWAHNDYLQIMAEAGFPALLPLIAIVLITLHRLLTAEDDETDGQLPLSGYLAGALAIFMQAGTNFMLYFPSTSLILGIFLAHAANHNNPGCINAAITAIRPGVVKFAATSAIVLLMLQNTLLTITEYAIGRFQQHLNDPRRIINTDTIASFMVGIQPSLLPHIHLARRASYALTAQSTPEAIKPGLINIALANYDGARKTLYCAPGIGIEEINFLNSLDTGTPHHKSFQRKVYNILEENLTCDPRHAPSIAEEARLIAVNNSASSGLAALDRRKHMAITDWDQMLLRSVRIELSLGPGSKLAPELNRTRAKLLSFYDPLIIGTFQPGKKILYEDINAHLDSLEHAVIQTKQLE